MGSQFTKACRISIMQLFPSHNQWRSWSLPSKLTAIGAYVGVMGVLLTVAVFAFQMYREERIPPTAQSEAPALTVAPKPNDPSADLALLKLSAALRELRGSLTGGRLGLASCRGDLDRAGKVSDGSLKRLVQTLEDNSAAIKEFTKSYEEFEAFGEPAIDQDRYALCFHKVEASFSRARALSDRMQPRFKHIAANLSAETADESAVQIMQAAEEFFDHQEQIVNAVDDCVFANLLTRD